MPWRSVCSQSIMALEEAFIVILALAVASLWLIANSARRRINNTAEAKPPHPPSWPILGHIPLLFRSKQPFHRFLSSLSETYGPIMQLQLGARPVLVICSSDLVKECFTTNDKAFASRPHLSTGKYIGYDFKVFGFAPYGSYWRDIRKLCRFQIFSAQRVESFSHVRAEEASTLIRSLFESWKQQINPVRIKTGLPDLSYNVLARIVASKRFSPDLSPQDLQEAHNFKMLMEEFVSLTGAFEMAHSTHFLNWGERQRTELAVKNLKKKIDVAMKKVIDDHRETRGVQDRDLVDVLISATDNHEVQSDCNDDVVTANAVGMITSGSTVSAAVEWAVSALIKRPDMLGKVQQELDMHVGRERIMEESDVPKLKYLQAVVKETLRLYPPGPILSPHESAEECTVGGYHIPTGTHLLVNVWAIQRDSAVWERPAEFDPERFLESGREIDVKGRDFELIPFGSGRRMCPAMPLALSVVTYTLGRLLQSFEWSAPEGTEIDMQEGFGFTMFKAIPLEAIIKPRLPLHLY